jgi:hypothetical protein
LLETDVRLRVVVVNSQQELVSPIISHTEKGSVSVHDNVMHPQIVKVALCNLGKTRSGQKVTGLSSEGAVRHYCAAQGRNLNQHFYLRATRRLPDAVRRSRQEMAVC